MSISFPRRTAMRAGIGVAVLGGVAASVLPAKAQMEPAILEVMESDGRFTRWLNLIKVSGLGRFATNLHPFTMFAPTDDALSKYQQPTYDALLGINRMGAGAPTVFPDLSLAIRVVRSNVIAGTHPPAEFIGKKVTLMSETGAPIEVDGTAGGNTLKLVMHVLNQVSSMTAETATLTARDIVVYPVSEFDLGPYIAS